MDALFGEVDAVAAGERETSADKIEAITYSGGRIDDIRNIDSNVEKGGSVHVAATTSHGEETGKRKDA